MKATPDTITEVRVFLTATEIGKALGNRADDEQVEALCAWVDELGDKAELQACYIGGRMFQNAKTCEKAIEDAAISAEERAASDDSKWGDY